MDLFVYKRMNQNRVTATCFIQLTFCQPLIHNNLNEEILINAIFSVIFFKYVLRHEKHATRPC